MEENENNEVVENTTQENVDSSATSNKVVETIKSKKNLIIAIICVIVAVLVIRGIFFNAKGHSKSVIKDFCKAYNKQNVKKLFKTMDPAGIYTFMDLDEDDYKDFWKEYKDYKKSDEWKDQEEEWNEMVDKAVEEAKDNDDDDDDYKMKVGKVEKFKKVGSHLYEIEVNLIVEEDGDKDDQDVTFYIMKKGLSYKIVGGDMVSWIILAATFSSAL